MVPAVVSQVPTQMPMSSPTPALRTRARNLREQDGLSVRAIARLVGAPTSTVGQWVEPGGEPRFLCRCEWCGHEFQSERSFTRWCSSTCSARAKGVQPRPRRKRKRSRRAVNLKAVAPLGHVLAVRRAVELRNRDPKAMTWMAIALVMTEYHGFKRSPGWWAKQCRGEVEPRYRGGSYR